MSASVRVRPRPSASVRVRRIHKASKMASGGHFCEKKITKYIKVAYWSEITRNAIKSDFLSSKMWKRSCVLIWSGAKCDRKWISVRHPKWPQGYNSHLKSSAASWHSGAKKLSMTRLTAKLHSLTTLVSPKSLKCNISMNNGPIVLKFCTEVQSR